MTEHPVNGAPLTRRELRELERRRVLEASAALAELAAAAPAAPSHAELAATLAAPSHDEPARPAQRETWQPPAAPTSTGSSLTRRELRQRNVEVEPVRLSVPSQSPASALESPSTVGESGVAPTSGVASIPVSTIREHAHDQDHLPASALAAAVQGRRAGMRDAAAARPRPVEGIAAGGVAAEVGGSVALAARTGPTPAQDDEPPVVTDGFGMPAVFMDAPVLPALRPIEEFEAELVREALGGSPAGDGPAPDEADEPDGQDAPAGSRRSVEPVAGPVGPVESAAGPVEPSSPAAPGARAEEPVARTFEPARTATVPSPRTVTSRRLGLEHPVARTAPAAPRRRPRAPAPSPQRSSGDVLKIPAGRWQAVYGAWIGVAAVAVWALGPVALVLGLWALVQARVEGYGRGRPYTAIVGGVVGTVLGVLFLLNASG